MITLSPQDKARFWSKVDTTGVCWQWTAALNEHGYGIFSAGGRSGRMHLAHRVAYELEHSPIPVGLQIRHACDNPPCVNPDHLSVGTHADNTLDRTSRGRQAKGTDFPHARLTDGLVAEIRSRYEAGGVTQRDLAAEYGIAQSAICNVVNRRRWKHVA